MISQSLVVFLRAPQRRVRRKLFSRGRGHIYSSVLGSGYTEYLFAAFCHVVHVTSSYQNEWTSDSLKRSVPDSIVCYHHEVRTGAGVYSCELRMEQSHLLGRYCSNFHGECFGWSFWLTLELLLSKHRFEVVWIHVVKLFCIREPSRQ